MKTKMIYLMLLVILFVVPFLSFHSSPISSVYATDQTLTLRPNATGTYSQFVQVPSGFVWGDQFEDGNAAFPLWTSVTGVPVIATSPIHHGLYSMQTDLSVDNAHQIYVTKTFTGGTNCWFHFTVGISALPSWNSQGRYFIQIRSGSNEISLGYEKSTAGTGGVLRWIFVVGSTVNYYPQTLSVNTPYVIDIEYDAVNDEHILYVDGTPVITDTTARTSSITNARIGSCGLVYTNVWTGTVTFDCFIVSTASTVGTENHFNLVNDSSDNTALRVTASTTQKETENLADTSQTGTISSVAVYCRSKATLVTNQFVHILRTYSTDYEGAEHKHMTTSYEDY